MQSRWKPHVTVAAVIEQDGRFMLVEERSGSGLALNNPAGHLERGESLVQACVREVLEETAHAFAPTALLGVYLAQAGEGPTYLRFAFCGTLGQRIEGRALDEGIVRTLWLTREEIAASGQRLRSPVLLRCIDDYVAGVRLPLSALHTAGDAAPPA